MQIKLDYSISGSVDGFSLRMFINCLHAEGLKIFLITRHPYNVIYIFDIEL